jgi:hypothetical protein
MANYNIPAVGEQSSLGIVKESTAGTFPGMTGALYHALTDVKFTSKNVAVPRTGARKRWGQTLPATGSYESSGTIAVESQVDTIGQLVAYALGAQSTPSQTIVNLTLSASTIIGATEFPVGTSLPVNVVPGMTITIDTSTSQEILTVAHPAITSSSGTFSVNTTAGATKAHNSGVGITVAGTDSYYTKMTLGLLPSFSAQLQRGVGTGSSTGDTRDYLGCMMESMAITMNAKGGLDFKFTIANLKEQNETSPASPSFSTKFPFVFENPNNWQVLGGAMVGVPGSSVSVISLSATLNTNLDKTYFSGSSGRYPYAFVQQQRSVKGSVTFGFEDQAAYELFLGSSGSTTPQFPVSATSFAWVCAGQDTIDSGVGVPYLLTLEFPNIWPEENPVDVKASGPITQTFTFSAAESGTANDDDLTVHYVGTNSAAF